MSFDALMNKFHSKAQDAKAMGGEKKLAVYKKLFVGHWYNIIETIIVTWMSATLFAIGTVGYYRFPINKLLRVVILLVALILIIPGMVSDLIGVFFMGGLKAWQRIQSKRLHMSAIDSGTGGPSNAG